MPGKWVMATLETEERSHKERDIFDYRTWKISMHKKEICWSLKVNQEVTKYLEQIYHTINIFIT